MEWPLSWETFRHNWRGSVRCIAYITAHSQQICGLSWSPSGNLFATGGNDNLCFLFETVRITNPEEEIEREQVIERLWSAFREPMPPPSLDLTPFADDTAAGSGWPNRVLSPLEPGTSSSAHRQISVASSGAGSQPEAVGSIDDRLSIMSASSPFARFFNNANSNTRFWDLNRLVTDRVQPRYPPSLPASVGVASDHFRNPVSNISGEPRTIDDRQAKHRWEHTAAVKAIAFCPWREGLVATGGGSHDKCIHFYHTTSGVALATIAVHAQVTSLIWSSTRREIAATFGYAQPDHPYRIAVFSWPECRQVAAIPWEGEHRALYAIPYPQGPPDYRAATRATGTARDRGQERVEREKRRNRTATEGCIVVAASDESIKFHEVWSGGKKATVGGSGLLGGSDILEDLEGIDKEGDVIR